MQHVEIRRRPLVFALLAATGIGLCAASVGIVHADSPSVAIDNFTFGPDALTVPGGTTVSWTNRDDIPHTVTSEATPRLFRSRPLDTGDTFRVTFDKPGTYRYFCSLHPHMQGTVIVR